MYVVAAEYFICLFSEITKIPTAKIDYLISTNKTAGLAKKNRAWTKQGLYFL